MTPHLADDELVRWRDHGDASQRDRVVAHLAECDRCGASYAELVRTAPVTGGPRALAVAPFVERGYRMGMRGASGGGWSAWRPQLAAAAALLVVLGGASLMLSRREPPALRGGAGATIEAVRPVNETVAAEALEFVWRARETAAVTLLVYDASRPTEPVIRVANVQPGYRLTPDDRARLRRGRTYTWFVEQHLPRGTIDTSPAARFTVR